MLGGDLVVRARAQLPTRHGAFTIVAFARVSGDPIDDIALVRGEVSGAQDLDARLHSECVTGDVLGSTRCDCRDQLERALNHLGSGERGVLLYLRQEGRGIGIASKVAAYAHQDAGLDTVEANEALGFAGDLRDYQVAAAMLRALGVHSVRLFTNNPAKVAGLVAAGIGVVRESLVVESRPETARYLATKRSRLGHLE